MPQAELAGESRNLSRILPAATNNRRREEEANAANPERLQELQSILNLLRQRTTSLARYTCGNCGFRARRFYWQCPGCNNWEAYSPRRSEGVAPSGPSM